MRPRKTNGKLLEQVQKKLRKLDLVEFEALKGRLDLLHGFEARVLHQRILDLEDPTSRTQLAIDARLGGPQAAQLERKMLVRVLGILHNAKRNQGGPDA